MTITAINFNPQPGRRLRSVLTACPPWGSCITLGNGAVSLWMGATLWFTQTLQERMPIPANSHLTALTQTWLHHVIDIVLNLEIIAVVTYVLYVTGRTILEARRWHRAKYAAHRGGTMLARILMRESFKAWLQRQASPSTEKLAQINSRLLAALFVQYRHSNFMPSWLRAQAETMLNQLPLVAAELTKPDSPPR